MDIETTTYHCAKCITPLFRNEIILCDTLNNKIIIKKESTLNIQRNNRNIAKCRDCKTSIGKYESITETYIIEGDSIIKITIQIE